MDFQKIMEVNDADFYLDIAFKRSKKNVNQQEVFCKYLINTLDKIVHSFPSFDNLSEFHKELVSNFFDYDLVKKHLGTLKWAKIKIKDLQKSYSKKFKENKREFFGRAVSVLKQINPSFEYLENARKIMREFPSIKEDLLTVCIAGFPNVGKTTLLSKITSSKPEINDYAFTTKVINIGYIQRNLKKLQVLDTPGTLNRLDKMNTIEKQAYLAMRYVADLIVCVFDLTYTYDLKLQEELYNKILDYDKPCVIYLSKTDLIDKQDIKDFERQHKDKNIIADENVLIDFLLNFKKNN